MKTKRAKARCGCCKRLVPLDTFGNFCSHGGGACRCDTLLCQHSGLKPDPSRRTR